MLEVDGLYLLRALALLPLLSEEVFELAASELDPELLFRSFDEIGGVIVELHLNFVLV